ncbi:hypothetical protein [Rhizobium terrae]|nr:hypothetical protein [Rhizobium terrae]
MPGITVEVVPLVARGVATRHELGKKADQEVSGISETEVVSLQ